LLSDIGIKVEKRADGVIVLSPRGGIDDETYGTFEKKACDALKPPLKGAILDMASVGYVSSVGFGAIFRIKQNIEKMERHWRWLILSPT
jgi:anti-anti-sigma regulatory factor